MWLILCLWAADTKPMNARRSQIQIKKPTHDYTNCLYVLVPQWTKSTSDSIVYLCVFCIDDLECCKIYLFSCPCKIRCTIGINKVTNENCMRILATTYIDHWIQTKSSGGEDVKPMLNHAIACIKLANEQYNL